MPLDWEEEDSVKLGKDLLPGDCIRDKHGSHLGGIILKVDVDGLRKFYDGKPNYEAFCINDSSNGPYSSHLKLEEEFEIINARKDIKRYYDIIELDLLSHAADLYDYRRQLKDVQSDAFDRLNVKLRKLKKELKDAKSDS